MASRQIEEFIAEQRLPHEFLSLIERHYVPLAAWLIRKRNPGETLFIGISGAQGTGKSTLAAYLQLALQSSENWQVTILAIDDFYLTKTERKNSAKRIHPLLETRGVPGTHDMRMLSTCVYQLKHLAGTSKISLPRFDKALDDRADGTSFPNVSGPVDLLILEGWCVGSKPQSVHALSKPINSLEKERDASGSWRRYVNEQLNGSYADLFAQLDALIFLRAPNFEAVHRWRLEQEEKLADATCGDTIGIMNARQLTDFIQYYERLTRANLETLPDLADVVLELDDNHNCVSSHYAR